LNRQSLLCRLSHQRKKKQKKARRQNKNLHPIHSLISSSSSRPRPPAGRVALPHDVEAFLHTLQKNRGDQRWLLKHAADTPDRKDLNTPDNWVPRHKDLIRLTGRVVTFPTLFARQNTNW
jgi:hypothetical protein